MFSLETLDLKSVSKISILYPIKNLLLSLKYAGYPNVYFRKVLVGCWDIRTLNYVKFSDVARLILELVFIFFIAYILGLVGLVGSQLIFPINHSKVLFLSIIAYSGIIFNFGLYRLFIIES